MFGGEGTGGEQPGCRRQKYRYLCHTLAPMEIVANGCMADVRFKNYGLDSIEVQDNGDGIAKDNYETVALKHHTSKLASYADLATLQTFGFRGEALSSLCALSTFTVTTCTAADAPKGTKLDFEVSGKLKGTALVAAQKGTTVTVEKLFSNLPVRRRELERNIKREWNKVVGHLSQYSCIQTGVKISVSHQPSKGKKNQLFSTKGNDTTRENIAQVFGAKILSALLPLNLELEMEPTSGTGRRLITQEDEGTTKVNIVGHISRPVSGEGRQTPDRQMFFVNARPCGLPQIAKAFNEVYKSYNSSQSPFIFANIELDTHLYDVNVSPDKRTIMLHDQDRMLEHLKSSLIALFESQAYTVPVSQLMAQKQSSSNQPNFTRLKSAGANMLQAGEEDAVMENKEDGIEAEEHENENGELKRKATDEPEMGEEEKLKKTNQPEFRRRTASRQSIVADAEARSLMSKWLDKKTEGRGNLKVQSGKESQIQPEGQSEDNIRPIGKFDNDEVSATEDEEDEITAGSDVPVQDFNKRVAELAAPKRSSKEPTQDSEQSEESIPALTFQSTPPAGTMASRSSRPARIPPTMATITIGDKTVTSSIGTPSPKRPRVARASEHRSSAKPRGREDLTFGSRLSQRFAAPGTAQDSPLSEEEPDDEASEDSGRSSREASVYSEHDEQEEAHSNAGAVDGIRMNQNEQTADVDMDSSDDEFVDEEEKKAREEAKVQEIIAVAEEEALKPLQDSANRMSGLLKGGSKTKNSTVHLSQTFKTNISEIKKQLHSLKGSTAEYQKVGVRTQAEDETTDVNSAEEKLSLTISKDDFAKMKIIGQFNLGFILATRTSSADGSSTASTKTGDLFIIDQHASDEKYNFERLQATTVVASQRSVRPKALELTAIEEETVLSNLNIFERNGFIVAYNPEAPTGSRCALLSLPISQTTTFSVSDFEELVSLLAEYEGGERGKETLRCGKLRKMFAMRACRSSIMIGRTLSTKQMASVVRHMGEIDKPWNCPHGRPTMRHLAGLGGWDEWAWKEGDGRMGEKKEPVDWAGFLSAEKASEENGA
jgi:DNA mismatch repair protein PMS2